MFSGASRAIPAFAIVAIATMFAGCGKTGPQSTTSGGVSGGGPLQRLAPVEAEGAVSVTTRNTTRVGGADSAVTLPRWPASSTRA